MTYKTERSQNLSVFFCADYQGFTSCDSGILQDRFCLFFLSSPLYLLRTVKLNLMIMWTGTYDVEYTVLREQQQDFTQYIVFNPRVKAVANLSVVSQEVYAIEEGTGALLNFPLEGTIYSSPWEVDEPLPDITDVCIKVVVKVAPKNGAPASYITKTFLADNYTITCI